MTVDRSSSGKRRGRPPKHLREERQYIIEAVLQHIADGLTLPEIEELPGMPPRQTLNSWIATNAHGAADRYRDARAVRADRIALQIFDIADNADTSTPAAVNKARLQCDVRKWYLSHILPEKYGDMQRVEIEAKNTLPLVGIAAIDEVQKIRQMLNITPTIEPPPIDAFPAICAEFDNAIEVDEEDSE